MDVHRDRILIVGSRKEGKKYSPDNGVAWLGALNEDFSHYRVITYQEDTETNWMMRCGWLSFGDTRFLADGSFVVVPWAERNVYLYRPDGRLLRVWNTDHLGIATGCDFLESIDYDRFDLDPVYRYEQWNNRQRLVDAIVPLPRGFGLVVRYEQDEQIRWDLLELQPGGETARYRLDFAGASLFSEVEADFAAGELVFLMNDLNNLNEDASSSRLIFTGPPG